MNTANKAVLDRRNVLKVVDQLKDLLELSNEVLDYGTHLIPRAYKDSGREQFQNDGPMPVCVLFVLLRQFLIHLDGVTILAFQGNAASARLQLRSIIEIAHQTEWILAGDTRAKILHFAVAQLRKLKHQQSIGIPGSPESKRHTYESGLPCLTEELRQKLREDVEWLDKTLTHSDYASINALFEQHYVKHGYDKHWYQVYSKGIRSAAKIAAALNKEHEYYLYHSFSEAVHGNDMWRSVTLGAKNRTMMNGIREPQDIPGVVRLAISYAIRLYGQILAYYRPMEAADNFQKQLQEWRPRFDKTYEFTIKTNIISV